MLLNINSKDIKNIHIIGDRVLIKPKSLKEKTKTGLYLPPTVKEKELAQLGYIIKVGPGIPIPSFQDENETWKKNEKDAKYIPLQVQEGDLAVYMNNTGVEVVIDDTKYIIVPQTSILMIVRDSGLFE